MEAGHTAGNGDDGSLKLLRQLKDAETAGEATLRAAEAEATAELAELKKRIGQQTTDAAQQAQRERADKLQAAIARAQKEAQGIVAQARQQAALVRPFTPAEIDPILPDILGALFADINPSKKGKR